MSAALIKYRTGWFSDEIERVDCTRETEKSVYVVSRKKLERREAKRSEMAQYHDSWSDARDYLRAKAAGEVSDAEWALRAAEGKLAKIIAMTPPRGAA